MLFLPVALPSFGSNGKPLCFMYKNVGPSPLHRPDGAQRRRLVARNHTTDVALFGGSADEVLFGWPKRLDAQSAMADVSLAAMAGVTAADHERISKFCTP